jgi:3-hydroxyacyl-[acyl-carrier-protein] dehydratase
VTGPAYAAPLRAVDRVEVTRTAESVRVTATKTVDPTDPYLPGHFPGRPVFPGVFMIEAVRQAVCSALGAELVAVHSVRFIRPALAGDVLTFDVTVRAGPAADASFDAEARCRGSDGSDVARMRIGFQRGTPADA